MSARNPCLPRRAARLVPGLVAAALMLIADSAAASAFVRFANVSLQEVPATDRLQLRLDDAVVIDELGYKSATGYLTVAAGRPQLSVWYRGARLLERELDLRDGRGYAFVLLGNGESRSPYDVTAFYEGDEILEETTPRFQILAAAPYPGHPRAETPPTGASVRYQQSCRDAGTAVSGSSGSLRMPVGLPIQPGPDAAAAAASGDKTQTDLDPDSCRIEFSGLAVAPSSVALTFPRVGGSWTQLFLVGDGIRAPIEVWRFSQRGRVVDPPAVRVGDWAAGIWFAPEYPGLVFNLDFESIQLVSGPSRRLTGLVTGYDEQGQPRWNRLNSLTSLLETEQTLRLSEYLGSDLGSVNEIGLTTPTTLRMKFLGCYRARLTLSTIFVDLSRQWAIAALHPASGAQIELQRATPLSQPCPY